MSSTMPFVLNAPPSPENIPILLVSPHSDDLANLGNILHHRDWTITQCETSKDASRLIHTSAYSIVLTEGGLPDGSWKDVLHTCDGHAEPPLVLVVSRHADDRLWAEVLSLGGYDVLLKPFERSEVTRVVGMAWRCWFGAFRNRLSGRPSSARAYA